MAQQLQHCSFALPVLLLIYFPPAAVHVGFAECDRGQSVDGVPPAPPGGVHLRHGHPKWYGRCCRHGHFTVLSVRVYWFKHSE